MSDLKYMGVSVSINDKHFVLVKDSAVLGGEACDHCALQGKPFCYSGRATLLTLCCIDDYEGGCFFKEVESWSDLSRKE